MRASLQIRWKILIVLLAIGIGPLLISAWLDTRSVSALGARLAEQSGQALSEQTRRNLELVAENYARRVERERQLIELALRLQAREAGTALRAAAPATDVFWAAAFDAAVPALALVTEPDKYRARANDGSVAPVPVSFDRQVFFNPQGTERLQLRDDAARLTALTSLYREIHTDHRNVIYRQFIALANGLLASYPGHGAFPPDYDARKRAWYREHDSSGDIRWAPPHIDAVSGRAFINATIALHDPDGQFVGVAGIDVSLVDLLQSLTLPAALGSDGEALLTYLIEHADADADAAEIGIAARTHGSTQTTSATASSSTSRSASNPATSFSLCRRAPSSIRQFAQRATRSTVPSDTSTARCRSRSGSRRSSSCWRLSVRRPSRHRSTSLRSRRRAAGARRSIQCNGAATARTHPRA